MDPVRDVGDPGDPGDPERRWLGRLCEAEVAWWRKVGGAVAMALAFARLAAMAAATLDFFVAFGVVGGAATCRPGFGQALSSCFRAGPSRDSNMTEP